MNYSKDGVFIDPVVRCDSCNKILLVKELKKNGACICGSRKIKNLRGYTQKEKKQMKQWGVDPDFFALFEPDGKTLWQKIKSFFGWS